MTVCSVSLLALTIKSPKFFQLTLSQGWLATLSLALWFFAAANNALGGQVTLTWDGNPDPQLGGYKIYYGLSQGNYAWTVDVGNQTSYVLTDLKAGQTYYFAVTAYDRLGQAESDFSPETQASIPVPVDPPVANFTAVSNGRKSLLRVAFTDTTTGKVTAWNWSFGDGTTSSSKNPVHDYVLPGIYSVTLKVTGPGGSNSATKLLNWRVR